MRAFAVVRTVVYMAGFFVLWAWMVISVRRFDAVIGLPLPAWLAPLGRLAMLAGGVIAIACSASFAWRGHGTPVPFDPPVEFVASGPYRWVRNPMYVGGALILAGYALAVRSPAVLAMTAVLLSITHGFVVLVEEPGLRARFGASYADYTRSVNRWVPRRPRDRSEPPDRPRAPRS